MFFQQVHNDDDGQNADGREKVPLPSRLGCQKTEGGAFVINQNQVEKRRYPDGLAVMKDMGNPDLADLVEQDDCNCKAQPVQNTGFAFVVNVSGCHNPV